jgi:hypothetical protein
VGLAGQTFPGKYHPNQSTSPRLFIHTVPAIAFFWRIFNVFSLNASPPPHVFVSPVIGDCGSGGDHIAKFDRFLAKRQ